MRQSVSPAAKTRQLVAKLRQFYLELRLLGRRALSEDVKDELRPIDDLPAERLFQVPSLAGTQFVVEDDDVGADLVGQSTHFFCLTLADERRAVGAEAVLDHRRQGGNASGVGKRLELVQQVLRVAFEIDSDEDRLLRPIDTRSCAEVVLDERSSIALTLTLLVVQCLPPRIAASRPAGRSRARCAPVQTA